MGKEYTALEGLQVIELANECGVYCGKLLVGMGANVIKVERPGGDSSRSIGPFFQDVPHPEKSLCFAYYNTGKKSITLNIETKDGQDILKKLIKSSDVVLETFPVGYLENLGLGYSALKKLNPALVMTSITPFGQTGPNKGYSASSEIIPFAMGGLMFMTGEKFTPPVQVGNFLVGYGVSIYATLGTLAAIHNCRLTGEGAHIDISMQECVASWLEAAYARYQYSPHQITTRFGNRMPAVVPGGLQPCKDGYFFIASQGRWNLIIAWLVSEGIDVGELADPKYETMDGMNLVGQRDKVDKLMRELGMKYTKLELMTEGQKRGIPVTIMGNAKDVYEDEHLKAREYFVDVEHPTLGKLKYPGAPYKMMGSPWRIGGPAPLVGEHNEEIYGTLGLSQQDLVTLKAAHVI